MLFSDLGLADPLLRAVERVGYQTATPIQAAAIPIVLSGADLVGCAQTGTGKTAAFTLPTIDRLTRTPRTGRASGPRVLVLSPTRELAAQIGESFQRYGAFAGLSHTVIFGGVSQHHQVKALRRGVDVLVATPGRLLDLKEQGYVKLDAVETLVLDEADQMLDMGFLPALRRIVGATPRQRQTLMFSATMPDEIRTLANEWLRNPQSVATERVASTAEGVEQALHYVDKGKKPELLQRMLDGGEGERVLVFTRTKHGADRVVKQLTKDGVDAVAIHGNKSQGQRTRALDRFRGRRPPVLVATDVAARGLDISEVALVVNYDLPDTPETYVHRIGRTGRAGKTGCAASFCAADEHDQLAAIEKLIKKKLPVAPSLPGLEPREAPVAATPAKKPSRGGRPSGPRGGGRPAPAKARSAAKSGRPSAAAGGPAVGPAAGGSAAAKPRKRRRKPPTFAASRSA